MSPKMKTTTSVTAREKTERGISRLKKCSAPEISNRVPYNTGMLPLDGQVKSSLLVYILLT